MQVSSPILLRQALFNLVINLQSLLTSVAPLPCWRAGGFASPPRSGFALLVCDNMHNVGNHYKVVIPRGVAGLKKGGKSANCVTLLWPKKSSKTC